MHTISKFAFSPIRSCWQLEASSGGSVHTMDILKNALNQSLFAQLVNFLDLQTHHCPSTMPWVSPLLRSPMTIRLPDPAGISVYFILTSQSHLMQLITSAFWKCFTWTPRLFFPWFSSYFTDHSFLVPWPVFLFISPVSKCWLLKGSVLRTFFFSIYTHFLGKLTHAHVFKYPP